MIAPASSQPISPWVESLSHIFTKLRKSGVMQSLNLFVSPSPVDRENFYAYHVIRGHKNNECAHLLWDLRRFINDGKLEELERRLSTQNNPLPNVGTLNNAIVLHEDKTGWRDNFEFDPNFEMKNIEGELTELDRIMTCATKVCASRKLVSLTM